MGDSVMDAPFSINIVLTEEQKQEWLSGYAAATKLIEQGIDPTGVGRCPTLGIIWNRGFDSASSSWR